MDMVSTQYIHEVSKCLVCPASLKKSFLRQLKADVQDYCDAHPNTEVAMISAHFGVPADIAEEFLSELSVQAIDRCTRQQKQTLLLTAAVILTAILTIAILVMRDHHLQQKLLDNNFVASITYDDDTGKKVETILSNPNVTK